MPTLTYVPAKEIWPNADNYEDKGLIPGYVRGYNVEVKRNGKVDWMSCVWVKNTIEDYLSDDFTKWWYLDLGATPTGRISFRGYGREEYCEEERENVIVEIQQL